MKFSLAMRALALIALWQRRVILGDQLHLIARIPLGLMLHDSAGLARSAHIDELIEEIEILFASQRFDPSDRAPIRAVTLCALRSEEPRI